MNIQKKLLNLHSDLSFLSERKKSKNEINLFLRYVDKENYVAYIRTLKQALNHGLVLKEVHRIIQFNEKEWLKPYIDTNTKSRTEAKNDFEKYFFRLMNIAVFGKAMENVRNHSDHKIVTIDKEEIN